MADIPEWIRALLRDKAFTQKGYAKNATRVRRDFVGKLRRTARRIPFATELLAAYYCALDPKTPTRVRATLLAALAYFILPLDGIPDFILGVGFGDDASVLFAAISMVSAHINDTHREAARQALDDDGDLSDDFEGPSEDAWTDGPVIEAEYEVISQDPASPHDPNQPKTAS